VFGSGDESYLAKVAETKTSCKEYASQV